MYVCMYCSNLKKKINVGSLSTELIVCVCMLCVFICMYMMAISLCIYVCMYEYLLIFVPDLRRPSIYV